MSTENRRVAAYLPKNIDDQLKAFKTDRGLKGDSQALIAILEEYFGVSREVAYPKILPFDTESFRDGLLSELKSELLILKMEIKSELLSELKNESIKAVEENVNHSKQLLILVNEETDQQLQSNELPSEQKNEPLRKPNDFDENKNDELSSKSASLLLDGSVVEPVVQEQPLENEQADGKPTSELLVETPLEEDKPKITTNLLGEPLFEIKPIPGVKLSKLRFNLPKDAIAGIKRKESAEKFAFWTKARDPDHIVWKYVESPSKGYIPAEELSSELQGKLLKWIEDHII